MIRKSADAGAREMRYKAPGTGARYKNRRVGRPCGFCDMFRREARRNSICCADGATRDARRGAAREKTREKRTKKQRL